MSIRLVRDDNAIFWFTTGNWRDILRFAELYGWPADPLLDPDNWDGEMELQNQCELVGGAFLSSDRSTLLADAIERGVVDDPAALFIVETLRPTETWVRSKLPDYDVNASVIEKIKRWAEFAAFARGRVLRVDWSD